MTIRVRHVLCKRCSILIFVSLLLTACHSRHHVLFKNTSSRTVNLNVSISDRSDHWSFRLAPNESLPVSFTPMQDSGLNISVRVNGELVIQEEDIGYFSPSGRSECLIVEVGFREIAGKPCQ
jgi:hypothetical protein